MIQSRIRLLLGMLSGAFAAPIPAAHGSFAPEIFFTTMGEDIGNRMEVPVVRLGDRNLPATVRVRTVSDTATEGLDFLPVSRILTFSPGAVRVPGFTLEVVQDSDPELFERFFYVFEIPGPESEWIEVYRNPILIYDDDPGTHLAVALPSATDVDGTLTLTLPETVLGVTFTIVREGPSDKGSTIDIVTAPETATGGQDFEPIRQTVSFFPGEKRRHVLIPLQADDLLEGPETFLVRLENQVPDEKLGYPRSARVTIQDNESGFHFAGDSWSWLGSEYWGQVELEVRRIGGGLPAASVEFTVIPGTAVYPQDYLLASTNLLFAAGETSQTVIIPLVNDYLVEGEETFSARLSDATGTPLGNPSEITVKVQDPHPPEFAGIRFDHPPNGLREDMGFARIDVLCEVSTNAVRSVRYATAGGTAIEGQDYVAQSGVITFAAGETRKTLEIELINDSQPEAWEYFTIRLSEPSGASLVFLSTTSVGFVDNDLGYGIVGPFPVPENAGTARIPVFRAGNFGIEGSVHYEATIVGANPWFGRIAQPGKDFLSVSGTLHFGANETEKVIDLPILDNPAVDGNRTLVMKLSQPVGPAQVSGGDTIMIIEDNEFSPNPVRVDPDFPRSLPPNTPRGNPSARQTVALQRDGKIIWATEGVLEDGYPGSFIQRLLPDGSPDPSFRRQRMDVPVRSLLILPDDRILIVPEASTPFNLGGLPRKYLARLGRDGEPDLGFVEPYAFEGMPIAAAANGFNGRILLASFSFSLDSKTDATLFQILDNGERDTSFAPVRVVGSISQAGLVSGRVAYVAGSFISAAGADRSWVAGIGESGTVLPGFSPGYHVRRVFPQANGGLLLLDGNWGMTRLLPDGSVDFNFKRYQFNDTWPAVVTQRGDGPIWCLHGACSFPMIIEAVEPDGTPSSRYPPSQLIVGPLCASVAQVFSLDDGQFLLSGSITRLNGTPASGLVRLLIEPESVFELAPESRSVAEDGGPASIKIRRTGPSDQPVALRWSTADATAIAGRNYQAAGSDLVFAPLETEKTVTVEILDNRVATRPQSFEIRIARADSEGTEFARLPVSITEASFGIISDRIAPLPDGRVRLEALGVRYAYLSPVRAVLEVSEDLQHWIEIAPVPDRTDIVGFELDPSVHFDPAAAGLGNRFYRVRTFSTTAAQ